MNSTSASCRSAVCVPRWRRCVAWMVTGWALAGSLGAAEERPLRVCLIAGTELPVYQAGQGMDRLKVYLEKNYPMVCTVLRSAEGSNSFSAPLTRLREADTAVFFVRRKTPSDADLAEIRRFVESGKGFVALRSTSHAWENWKTFDEEVLGAHYNGTFGEGKPLEVLNLYAHPIFTGARRFQTEEYGYAYEKLAPDAQILMDGVLGDRTTPMAWVRDYRGGRVFHLVSGAVERFSDENYLRMVGNGLLWVTRRPIPGAVAAIQRTYMPDAHPGALAITFPQGPGVCYDPVRGGINYVWDGDFVDLRPRWLTKTGEPARINGEIFYREPDEPGICRGPARAAVDFQWLGYRLNGAAPEFRYSVDGRLIVEEMRALPDGAGLERRIRVDPGEGPLWWMNAAREPGRLTVTGARIEGAHIRYDGTKAGEFTVVIRRGAGGTSR